MEELVLVLPLAGLFIGAFLIDKQLVALGLIVMIAGVVLVWIVNWTQSLCQGIFRIPTDIEKAGNDVNYESN